MEENELRRQIRARIKTLRKQRSWTQKQLAEKLGVRYQQLNKDQGGLNTPPADKLIVLAEVFQTSVDFLLTGERSEQRPLHNVRMLERFQAMEDFEPEDQEVILRLIDAIDPQAPRAGDAEDDREKGGLSLGIRAAVRPSPPGGIGPALGAVKGPLRRLRRP